jgi:hypothetical protein
MALVLFKRKMSPSDLKAYSSGMYLKYYCDDCSDTLTYLNGLSTFFGGHHREFASPKDQFVWFKDFSLRINDP